MSRRQQIMDLHGTYCQESGLSLPLDTATGNDRWGRVRAWHDFLKDGFTEAQLVQVIRHIKQTMKDPYRVRSLNFRKLIVGDDFFGEMLAEAAAALRNARRPLTNREKVLKATHRAEEKIPEPKTTQTLLTGEVQEMIQKLRKAAE